MTEDTKPDLPFEMHPCEYTILAIPGSARDTVLTIERQIFNVAIKEYTEPMFYRRKWCYPNPEAARIALLLWLINPSAIEPLGWLRAVEAGKPERRNGEKDYPNE